MNEFLKHQWKNFVAKMYFLIVQSKGLVESEIDETGNLFRNNEFLVNLNIVELLNWQVLPPNSLFTSVMQKECSEILQEVTIQKSYAIK